MRRLNQKFEMQSVRVNALILTVGLLFAGAPACLAENATPQVDAILRRAWEFDRHRKWKDAIQCYRMANQIQPTLAVPYRGIGNCLCEFDQPEEAIKNLNRSIELDPMDSDAFFDRSKAYVMLDDYKHGLADMDRAIQLHSENSAWFDRRASIELMANQKEKAFADLKKAIAVAVAVKDADALYSALRHRANEYRTESKYQQALDDYTAALKAEKRVYTRDRVLQDRAECYEKLGKHDLAAADRKQAALASTKVWDELYVNEK
jgi:tetratricopeptide (TPR) repeat protein